MKHIITKPLLLVLLPVLLAGCNSDNYIEQLPDTPPGQNGDITFEIGFAPQAGTNNSFAPQAGTNNSFAPQAGANDGSHTRATTDPLTRVTTAPDFASTWEHGDAIGLFAVPAGQPLAATGNYLHNVKLTYSTANGGSWTSSTPLCWPTTSSSITSLVFYAYHPYNDNGGSPQTLNPNAIPFSVQTDQSATTTLDGTPRSNYNLSELLTAKADNSGSSAGGSSSAGGGSSTGGGSSSTGSSPGYSKGATVPLIFSHALSLVQVTIPVEGKGFGPSPSLKVMLQGITPAATLNLEAISAMPGTEITLSGANNPANATNPTTITLHRLEQPADADYDTQYTYRALIPAQTLASDRGPFRFEHEDRQLFLDGEQPNAFTLTAGTAEKFTRTLPHAIHTAAITAGTFLMGSSDGSAVSTGTPDIHANATPAEPMRGSNEGPQHWVKLTRNFYMSQYEITNAQYAAFLNAKGVQGEDLFDALGTMMTGGRCTWGEHAWQPLVFDSSDYQPLPRGVLWDGDTGKWLPSSGYDHHPVIFVTWYGAYEYARWVGGTLPTEAQWEYAARAGMVNRPFGVGDGYTLDNTLDNFRWEDSYRWDGTASNTTVWWNSGTCPDVTQPVGTYPANGYGLYNMHGNVQEWCLDHVVSISDTYPAAATEADAIIDPIGTTGSTRVARGGYFYSSAYNCRSAYRKHALAKDSFHIFGFRVVFVP